MRKSTEFSQEIENPKFLSPLALAFIGDGVFELLVRGNIIAKGNLPTRKLHRKAVKQVNAGAQAIGYDIIIDMLNDEESDILRRGRNAKVTRVPRNVTVEEYHKSTALEALFGYLYLTGNNARINELYNEIVTKQNNDD